jgi:hypothetical protein
MLYLAFREKKPSRGKIGAGGAGRFDRDEYNRIVHFSVAPGAGDVASNIPQAVNPIGLYPNLQSVQICVETHLQTSDFSPRHIPYV